MIKIAWLLLLKPVFGVFVIYSCLTLDTYIHFYRVSCSDNTAVVFWSTFVVSQK